jgi:hypothetical protein
MSTIDPSLYQHRCPTLKTIAGVRLVVTGAAQLLGATLQAVGDVSDLRTKLQTMAALNRMLAGLDEKAPASSIGLIRDGICEAVMDAWTTCVPYFADAEVSQNLFGFLATNEAALVRERESKSSGWLVPTLVVIGLAGVAGGGYYFYRKKLRRKLAERKMFRARGI